MKTIIKQVQIRLAMHVKYLGEMREDRSINDAIHLKITDDNCRMYEDRPHQQQQQTCQQDYQNELTRNR